MKILHSLMGHALTGKLQLHILVFSAGAERLWSKPSCRQFSYLGSARIDSTPGRAQSYICLCRRAALKRRSVGLPSSTTQATSACPSMPG